ncbi:MAG: DUF3244 domain-containing protein [Bacteroidaceae bacterium]|nr:DUF3244 domain-containing protein [Bacteroidaceae bacterium]
MKKLFLFVAALVAVMSITMVYAKDIVIELKEGGVTLDPRSEIPVITASIDDGVCRTNVSEYSGNVHVAVKDAAGDTLISQTEAVFDSTQISTDVSGLADGSYTITYTLEDSTVFAGEFEKE